MHLLGVGMLNICSDRDFQQSHRISSHLSLFKDQKIKVILTTQGLRGFVQTLDQQGRPISCSPTVPLIDLPCEITRLQDTVLLKRYFRHVHLIPEKNGDGMLRGLSVHVSVKGGNEAKIPYQPGLALGSVVQAQHLAQMERYSTSVAAHGMLQKQLDAALATLKELEIRISYIRDPQTSAVGTSCSTGIAQQASLRAYERQRDSTAKFIETLSTKMDALDFPEIEPFSNFTQGLESPIDTGKSVIEVQPRGSDSVNYSSEYISMTESHHRIAERASSSSKAMNVSVSGGWGPFGASFAVSSSTAVSERLATIKSSGQAKSVVMINAMMTTRNVKCYTDLHFDLRKLQAFASIMGSGNKEEWIRHGISCEGEEGKEIPVIYILTEAVLGASFTALVTFLDENQMGGHSEQKTDERDRSFSGAGKGGYGLFSAAIEGSSSGQNTSSSSEDVLSSSASTNVVVEIIAQGAIPEIGRQIVLDEAAKYKDRAYPGKRGHGFDAPPKISMTQLINTPESAIAAYDSFASKITTDPHCGIPVGFNYRRMTLEDIEAEIIKQGGIPIMSHQSDTLSMHPTPSLSSSSSSSSSQGSSSPSTSSGSGSKPVDKED